MEKNTCIESCFSARLINVVRFRCLVFLITTSQNAYSMEGNLIIGNIQI